MTYIPNVFTTPSGAKIKLTAREALILRAAVEQVRDHPHAALTGNVLATMAGTSPQGAHQTAASLVRKGMLTRGQMRRQRTTVYGVPPRAVQAYNQLTLWRNT